MRPLLFLLLFSLLGLESGASSVGLQDSLPPLPKEIEYDRAEDLQAPVLSKETINKLKEDRAFDYSEKPVQENWWTQFKNWLWNLWLKFWHWLVGDYKANGFVAFLVHILPYLIISGILIFLGWLFYKLNPGATFFKSEHEPEVLFSDEEEIIKNKDISALIEKALANKNYRLAVRYYYLLILKKLTNADIISYEFDKTNSEYLSEITSETIKIGFKKATNLYDHVWYGNFEVTETDFIKAQHIFTSLENHLTGTDA